MVARTLFRTFCLCLIVAVGATACRRVQSLEQSGDPLSNAWNDYRLNEFNRAVATFQSVADKATPGSEEHIQALYGLATTWNLRLPQQDQDKPLAKSLYEKILEIAPQSTLAPWADLALARLLHLVPVGEDADYKVVRPAYQRIIDRYPGHLAAREAHIYLIATKVATLEPAELRAAVADLKLFLSQTNDTSFFKSAYSLLAVSCNTLGDQQGRLDAELGSLKYTEIDPTNPFNEFSWQYWNIATIAEFELGDFETARTYYKKLLEEYPRDRKVYGVKTALKRMDDLEAKLRAGGKP